MDASVSLMNQYTMIANQFPLPAPPTASVGTSTAGTSTSNETNANTETVEKPKATVEEKKTTVTAISDAISSEAGPSTSKAAIERSETDSTVTIEDIGRNDPSEPDEAISSEVRRRRLQRFEAKGVDS